MSLNAQAPFVSVLVWPVDPAANNRTQWTLSENYAGFFQAGSDGNEDDGAGVPGFKTLQYSNQPAFTDSQGPVEFVRFTSAGRVERGVSAALQANPSNELCGLTVQLRREPLQNRMRHDPKDASVPAIPTDAPPFYWVSEGGHWETVVAARTPLEACVHPYAAKPNSAFKIKTETPWDADRGFIMVCDFYGTTYGHTSDGAVRLTWGDKWSLVFRGQSTKARPSLERRTAGGWECVRVLRDCAPLDQTFWTSSHTVTVQRLGARLCIGVDGVEFGIPELDGTGQPTEMTWPRAPLRVSVWGAEAMFRVQRLTGDSTQKDGKSKPVPLQVSFTRHVPAPGTAPVSNLPFRAHGTKPDFQMKAVPGDIGQGYLGNVTTKTLMQGTGLDNVLISGSWTGQTATYQAVLQCTSTTSPLLCGLVCEFSPLPTLAMPIPIEVRPALTSLTIDSGDPESLPDAELSLSLSYPLLQQLVPKWEKAILPYRPIQVRVKRSADDEWTTLFRGFLTPDSASRGGWNDRQLPLVARGPLIRLSQPAALIDERFGPLDLQIDPQSDQLWGCQAAKILLDVELGHAWTYNFNGTDNGDPFRFLAPDHFPLLDSSDKGSGFFSATQTPISGGWYLPPPFGNDLKSWLDTLAKYDYAVWFYDHTEEAFFYGRITEFLQERGKQRWTVNETAPPSNVHTTFEWPLLSSLSQSGLLERAYNDVRVWGTAPKGEEGLAPSFIMGRAGDSNPASADPLSIAQSWRRTLLQKPELIREGVVNNDYANDLAFCIWQGMRGRPPVRMEAEFESGFLGPRWGEILHLPTGFDGPPQPPSNDPDAPPFSHPEDWRILRVKHSFSFSGSENRFSTTLSTRSLSANGQ